MNIFEELDRMMSLKSVNESDESSKAETVVKKKIPINPEMETRKQGIDKAMEKISKYFYKLNTGGMPGMPPTSSEDMDLPDDWLDPKFKGKMGNMKDKNFDKNKVLWDEDEPEDKLEKEVEVNNMDEDDEFDDFDYRDNEFGDDDSEDTDDMENSGGSGDDDSKSEDDKLKDAINDAIDKMRDDKESGSQGGSQESGQEGSDGENQSGSQEGGQNGSQSEGEGNSGSHNSGESHSSRKDELLSELKDSLDNGDFDKAKSTMDDMRDGESGRGNLAGENINGVTDEDLKSDMEKSGVSKKDIEEMTRKKDEDDTKSMSEDEMNSLKKEVVDSLNKKCEKRGGSALSKTIVKNAMKSKINNDEWKNMLKLFLKSKAVMNGDMAKSKNRIKYGHKNHLWRDAVLPTRTNGKGMIQNIYCFVDFSGSVEQDLVYTFLGRVIDLCSELNYTNVVVYGFGERIVLPREITSRMIKTQGMDVVLSQTWDFISSQTPGGGTENFYDVANEILEIRKKQRDAVYLIFGDAFWDNPTEGPMCLNTICGERLLDRMCVLTYYLPGMISSFSGHIAILKEMVGLKNVITTQASSIRA